MSCRCILFCFGRGKECLARLKRRLKDSITPLELRVEQAEQAAQVEAEPVSELEEPGLEEVLAWLEVGEVVLGPW